MCGIVGYIGKQEHKQIILNGLKELEYRGYDSAGFVCLENNEFFSFKQQGKISNLENAALDYKSSSLAVSIGHTRWATHGKPSQNNSHPHKGEFSYIVHNGIIENYQELKHLIPEDKFLSQTDSEVIVHLFEQKYEELKNTQQAFEETIKMLEGAFSILLISKKCPDKIYFAKQNSPLMIAKKCDEIFFASSDAPIIGLANEAIYLNDGDIGVAEFGDIRIFNSNKLTFTKLQETKETAQKNGYPSFMEKEINEQEEVINNTLLGRLKNNDIEFEELKNIDLSNIDNIVFCACGTSYHAALAGAYLFERLAKISCKVEVASEFRYKSPVIKNNTLFITLTQSGETADTLESLKMVMQNSNAQTLTICNVDNSSIVRQSQACILTRAGIEKGVASTKAFTTQIAVLWMLALYFAKINNSLSTKEFAEECLAVATTPNYLKVLTKTKDKIHRLSKRYLHGHGFFFIGRGIFYPLALEGALKLKEISYLHAEGYPAGEMKHGPISLADAELFTIGLCSKHMLFDKIKSNLEELSARSSTICAISNIEIEQADDWIKMPESNHYMQDFFAMSIIMQLLALEISTRLGNDVDMPRNLAKSVTVE